jgi:hypothetical protein
MWCGQLDALDAPIQGMQTAAGSDAVYVVDWMYG